MHLDTHRDEAEFDALYERKYLAVFEQARRFVRETQAFPQRTLVFISCGFDACTYEYPGMQRHGKYVPPHFYARFARDAIALADECADGKLVSVLEGGYSDRALTSGALAHVAALSSMPWSNAVYSAKEQPWGMDTLTQLERMAKRVAGVGRRAASTPAWLVQASEHFAAFQQACGYDARPLELYSTPSTPRSVGKAALRGLDVDLATPTRLTGGHGLRDRSVRRTRSQTALNERRVRERPPVPPLPPALVADRSEQSPTERRSREVSADVAGWSAPPRDSPAAHSGLGHHAAPGAAAAQPPATPDPARFVPGALEVESRLATPVRPLDELHGMLARLDLHERPA